MLMMMAEFRQNHSEQELLNSKLSDIRMNYYYAEAKEARRIKTMVEVISKMFGGE